MGTTHLVFHFLHSASIKILLRLIYCYAVLLENVSLKLNGYQIYMCRLSL